MQLLKELTFISYCIISLILKKERYFSMGTLGKCCTWINYAILTVATGPKCFSFLHGGCSILSVISFLLPMSTDTVLLCFESHTTVQTPASVY